MPPNATIEFALKNSFGFPVCRRRTCLPCRARHRQATTGRSGKNSALVIRKF